MTKPTEYATRVRELEDEGMSTSDAQSVADMEDLDDSCTGMGVKL